MGNGLKSLIFAALCLIWSSTWLVIKVGLNSAPPFTTAGLRFIIASAVIFAIVSYRRLRLPRTRSFFALTLYLGVFQIGVAYGLVYWGEQYLTSGLTAVLFSTMPIMVAVLARFILGDRLSVRKIAGVILGTAGVYVIFRHTVSLGGRDTAYGIIAALGSAFLASLSSVVVKRFSKNYNPFATILLPHAYGAVGLMATGLIIERQSPLQWSAGAYASVLYLALFGSVMAFGLYFWIIKHIDVTVLSYQTFIIPILACLLGWIFLGETVTLDTAAGGAMILSGIALSVLSPHRKRVARDT